MYDNLINKFKWAGVRNTDYIQIMTSNIKNNYSRLADVLIHENDFDGAEKVLDSCIAIMPNNLVPFNYFNFSIAEGYYRIGKTEKAREVISILTDIYFDELDYYNSLDEKSLSKIKRDHQRALQVISNMYNLTTSYNDEVSQKKIVELYELNK